MFLYSKNYKKCCISWKKHEYFWQSHHKKNGSEEENDHLAILMSRGKMLIDTVICYKAFQETKKEKEPHQNFISWGPKYCDLGNAVHYLAINGRNCYAVKVFLIKRRWSSLPVDIILSMEKEKFNFILSVIPENILFSFYIL